MGIWHPHGAAPGYWSPLQEGKDFEFSFITKPLEPFRDRVVLITGLDATSAAPTAEEPAGDHARGACIFSGARPRRDAVSPYLGVTIDQLIAQKWGQDTILSSLQLGVEDTGNFGSCNFGYSCAYSNCVSWPTADAAASDRSQSARGLRAVVRRWNKYRRSGLPDESRTPAFWIRSRMSLALFKKDLGAGDKARLDTYTENIREIERRIQIAMSNSVKEPIGEVPFGLPESKHVHYGLMYDLMALAFEGDITRSITLMLGRDLTGQSFPESGFNGGWHGSSHHGDKPENIANYAKINRYHVQNLAKFIEKLSKIPEGDGTVLDHVLIYKGTNMGNSHRHAHEKVPGRTHRRNRRNIQRESSHCLSRQRAAEFEHAVEHSRSVRHPSRQSR